MSAVLATTMVPDSFIPWHWDDACPERDGLQARPERLAQVVRLYAPSERSISAPSRLTRRGVAVLSGAVLVVAAALVVSAWLSAPTAHAAGRGAMPASVVVRGGDTLWTIAGRISPDRDTWAEVATLRQINHLTGVDLAVGQVLRTR